MAKIVLLQEDLRGQLQAGQEGAGAALPAGPEERGPLHIPGPVRPPPEAQGHRRRLRHPPADRQRHEHGTRRQDAHEGN